MAKFKRNNRRKYDRTVSAGSNYYNNYDSGSKSRTKKIVSYVISVIVIAIVMVLGAYVLTGGFYSNNLEVWDMQSGWYCPADGNVYEAENHNALISREFYKTEKNGKKLKVYLDPNVIDEDERNNVTFTVIYYSGTDPIYQCAPVLPKYDSMLDDNPTQILFDYAELEGKEIDIPGNSEGKKIDCVRLAVMYTAPGGEINIFKQMNFTKALIMEYV